MSARRLAFWALGIGLLPGLGCLVDFGGYSAAESNTNSGGSANSAGDGSEGGTRGGSAPNGGSTSGTSGTSGTNGDSGAPGTGGDETGGSENGGSTTGGSENGGSTTTGGSENGGSTAGGATTGGNAGRGGTTGGNAGRGGTTGGSAGASGAPMGGMSGSGASGGGAGRGGGSGGTGGSGGSGGTPGCPQTGRGPSMIEIPRPNGGIYCIDRTEVTNAQYDAFLAAAPAVSTASPCAWNTTYARQTGASCDPLPTTGATAPVACVDWCDAKAFCEWSGKRLCGTLAGGAVPLGSYADPASDAWFRACSHAGERRLPYGNTYDGSYCAGLDYGVTRPVNVATLSNCQGGYDGVWDMSGNVSEWEDACSATSGAADTCAHRGGSWYDLKAGAPLYCNSSLPSDSTPMPEVLRRDTRDIHVGFRCCASP